MCEGGNYSGMSTRSANKLRRKRSESAQKGVATKKRMARERAKAAKARSERAKRAAATRRANREAQTRIAPKRGAKRR